jgi:hypothetical protein
LIIQNFTIIHHSLTYPERLAGLIVMSAGAASILFAAVFLILIKRQSSRLK